MDGPPAENDSSFTALVEPAGAAEISLCYPATNECFTVLDARTETVASVSHFSVEVTEADRDRFERWECTVCGRALPLADPTATLQTFKLHSYEPAQDSSCAGETQPDTVAPLGAGVVLDQPQLIGDIRCTASFSVPGNDFLSCFCNEEPFMIERCAGCSDTVGADLCEAQCAPFGGLQTSYCVLATPDFPGCGEQP